MVAVQCAEHAFAPFDSNSVFALHGAILANGAKTKKKTSAVATAVSCCHKRRHTASLPEQHHFAARIMVWWHQQLTLPRHGRCHQRRPRHTIAHTFCTLNNALLSSSGCSHAHSLLLAAPLQGVGVWAGPRMGGRAEVGGQGANPPTT